MADQFDPRQIEDLTRVMEQLLHGLTGRDPRHNRLGTSNLFKEHFKKTDKAIGIFDTGIRKLSDTFKSLHNSSDEFLASIRHMTRYIIGAEVIVSAIKGGVDLGKTFSKTADIGQMFNGSMFKMAEQAGASGLSLEQFTTMLTKNSTASAVLNYGLGGTASGLGRLQVEVRKSLSSVGFYGMTLTQLTETTSDYAESLRQSGQLTKMDSTTQTKAIRELMYDVTAFSAATGKSRQEILKGVNAAFRETSAAMRMTTEHVNAGFTTEFGRIAALFSALPGEAGDMLPKFMAQLFGVGGNAFFTEMGNTFITAGMPQLNGMMGSIVDGLGKNVPIEQTVNAMFAMRDEILANRDALQAQANAGNQEAVRTLAIGKDMAGLSKEELIQKYKIMRQVEEQKAAMNKATQAALLFESNFHRVSGSFLEGFYATFGKAMDWFDPENDSVVKDLMISFKSLGTLLGEILGGILSKENFEYLGSQIKSFSTWLKEITGDSKLKGFMKGFIASVIDATKVLAKIIYGIGLVALTIAKFVVGIFTGIHSWLANGFGGMGDKWATITMVTVGAILYGLTKLFKSFFVAFAVINVGSAALGGGLLGGIRNLFGGGAGAAAGAAGGGGFFSALRNRFWPVVPPVNMNPRTNPWLPPGTPIPRQPIVPNVGPKPSIWSRFKGGRGGAGLAGLAAMIIGFGNDLLGGPDAISDVASGVAWGSMAGMIHPALTVPGAIAGGLLGAAGSAGKANAPMVDDYGRQIGTWGGKDEKKPTPTAPLSQNEYEYKNDDTGEIVKPGSQHFADLDKTWANTLQDRANGTGQFAVADNTNSVMDLMVEQRDATVAVAQLLYKNNELLANLQPNPMHA